MTHTCRFCPSKFKSEGPWEKHMAVCKLKKSTEIPTNRELTHAVIYLMGRVDKLEADARLRVDSPLARFPAECPVPALQAPDLHILVGSGLAAMLERHAWPVRAVEKKVYALADGEWAVAAPAQIDVLLGSIKHQLAVFLDADDENFDENAGKLYGLKPADLRAAILKN